MADSQTLTDDQLTAVARSGDSSLLRALTSQERDRMIAMAQRGTSDAGPAIGRLGRGPHGYPQNELGQEVTDAKGSVYQPGMLRRGMDEVSRVLTNPTPGMQLAGDVAALLSGGLGSRGMPSRLPETPAAVGEALSGVGTDASAVAHQVATGVIKKVTGIDAEAMQKQTVNNELVAARRRLQAARMQTRQQAAQSSADGQPAQTVMPMVSAPTEAPVASAPPATASTESTATGLDLTTARTPTIEGLLTRWAARSSLSLTKPELDTGVALVRQGAKPSDVVEAIAHHRNSPGAGGADAAAAQLMNKVGLPTHPETGGAQHARGVTGKWKVRPPGE